MTSTGSEKSTDGLSLASGLRVIEIGESIAAALAGMVLADYGAEVWVIEPPDGSRLRRLPGFPMWGRGKRFAPVDLAAADGQRQLAGLVADADVVIAALQPATADRLGVDGEHLSARHPRLVHCEITGFGRGHPMSGVAGYEAVVAARGGRAHEFGVLFGGERPAFPAVPVATYASAMLALQGVFAALVERERTGRGQRISTSLLDALGVYDMVTWAPGQDRGLRLADNPMLFYTVGRTSDGVWLQFSQNAPRLFRAFLRAIGLEHLLDEPRYARAPSVPDPDDAREMRAVLMARISERTWEEWQAVFASDPNVSAEPFARPGDALRHPQLLHTGDACDVDDPDAGPTRWLGPLVTCSATPPLRHPPAPRRAAAAGPLRWTSAPPPAGPTDEGSTRRLLQGVTVLEFSTWIATPTCTSLLADLGARVIKVEPLEGDPIRSHQLASYKTVQGKEAVTLDLKAPEGREIVHRLVADADVLAHNYRPGAPERLGIDYPTVRAINPYLVYLYAASYGSSGPMSARPAFHVTCGAVCGGALAQAGEGKPPPPGVELTAAELARWSQYLTRSNEANPDYNAGLAAAAAITMALWARERTGTGQALETRMMLSNAYTLSEHFIDYEGRPPRRFPDHDVHGLGALHRLYPASEGWLLVVAPGDREFAGLVTAIGRPALVGDARFSDGGARDAHDAELARELGAVFATRPAGAWEAELTSRGVACVEVHPGPHAAYIFDAPWAEPLGFVEMTGASGFGPYRRYGRAVRAAWEPGLSSAADHAGAHTRQVLARVGYDDDDVDKLLAMGVVAGS